MLEENSWKMDFPGIGINVLLMESNKLKYE
jgi:hypothetical protein